MDPVKGQHTNLRSVPTSYNTLCWGFIPTSMNMNYVCMCIHKYMPIYFYETKIWGFSEKNKRNEMSSKNFNFSYKDEE